jgi:hypothetical protein
MVALKEAEWIPVGGWVKGAHFNPKLPEGTPEGSWSCPAPHPVVDDPNLHPLTRLLDKSAPKASPHPIVADDIVLEVDEVLRQCDGFEPDIEGGRSIELEGD